MSEAWNFDDLLHLLNSCEEKPHGGVLPPEVARRLRQELARARAAEHQSQIIEQQYAQRCRRAEQAQATAVRSQQFAHSIVDSLDAHIAVLDKQGTILFVNKPWQAFARENGLSPERAGLGVSYFAACDAARGPGEQDARAAVEGLRALVRGERQHFQLEYPCHSPTQQRWFEMRARRFDTLGAVRLVVAHVNITAPRSDEQTSARAREAAEAANRAKDQFLAVLSHELRTPLTPVLLRLELMLHDPDLIPEMREPLEMIRRNVELETHLIGDVLDMTRIVRGKLHLQLQVVDAHEKLTAAAEIYRSEIEAKRLSVSFDLRAAEHHVRADPARLQQVFWNLISNAVKYTSEGGSIAIESTNAPGGMLSVRVIDTGIGIDPETMPRLFTAFEQGEQTLTRRYGGLGLGLSISKSLVEMHGGTLRAVSPGPGQGATFAVELKTVARAAAAQYRPTPPAPGPSPKPLRILLVEDNEDTVRVLSRQLEIFGYQVRTATSVHAALEVAQHEPFDLMIADIGLPDGTGWDLMRRLRGERAVRGIALSGFALEEDVRRSKGAGFVEHLAKPILPEQLQQAIQRAAWT